MPAEVTPAKFQNVVKRGFERTQKYRKARAMFMKEFVGQYYRDKRGLSGDEPLNLLFRTLSSFIPSLVMQSPINEVSTQYLAFKPYAELLGLSLDKVQDAIRLKDTLRAWIVSAFFAFGIMKVSLSSSENMIQYGDQMIDPGQVYAKLVDLDDFVIDPICTDMRESSFLGSRVRVPRQLLLDTDGYDNEYVMKLPASRFNKTERVEDLTKQSTAASEVYSIQGYVDVVELWVPEAQAMVTTSDPQQIILDKYLRVEDYYGPAEGPYVFLSFTPPVPNNPLPIAPVSMTYDMHKIANRTFLRMMEQADRQKDILAYQPAYADEAQDIIDAEDGDTVAVTNIDGLKTLTFGGVNTKNTEMVGQFQMWFNYMSGNPDQVSGNQTRATKGSKETATKASIMQSNASSSIEDARGIIYDATGEVSRRMAWFFHHDPLINMPLTKRTTGGEYQQLVLTPEQRQGDFIDFMFKIRARSLTPVDPQQRARLLEEFAVKIFPGVTNAALIAMQMRVPFNLQKCLTDLAEQLGLTADVMSWFDDPEFEQKLKFMLQMGPQNPGKAGSSGQASTQQNGQSPMVGRVRDESAQFNSDAQAGANNSQSINSGAY